MPTTLTYYPCDETGAAYLSCTPAHWSHILTYLHLKVIADSPPPTLIAEARELKLHGMVAALEAAKPPPEFVVTALQEAEGRGFSVNISKSNVVFDRNAFKKSFICLGRVWAISVTGGVYIYLESSLSATLAVRCVTTLGTTAFTDLKEVRQCERSGHSWETITHGLDPAVLLTKDGKLELRIDVVLLDPKDSGKCCGLSVNKRRVFGLLGE